MILPGVITIFFFISSIFIKIAVARSKRRQRRGNILFLSFHHFLVVYLFGSNILDLILRNSNIGVVLQLFLKATVTLSSSILEVKAASSILLSNNPKTVILSILQPQKQQRRLARITPGRRVDWFSSARSSLDHNYPTYDSLLDVTTYVDEMLYVFYRHQYIIGSSCVRKLNFSHSNQFLQSGILCKKFARSDNNPRQKSIRYGNLIRPNNPYRRSSGSASVGFAYNPLVRSHHKIANSNTGNYPDYLKNQNDKATRYPCLISKVKMSSSRNKRANLPFSIMDKEIEEYTNSLQENTNKKVDGTTAEETIVIDDNQEGSIPKKQLGEKTVTEYEKWVRRLYATNLFLPVKLGLENMERIHTALGNPSEKYIIIHIAGTNGKGSVTYKIAQAIQLANPTLKVGLFFSPHVSSFRERIQVNNIMISEDDVVQLLPPIYEICQKEDIPATFFEITTALAFSYYAKMSCDVIVLETGLGGRLDATNIVKTPAISVITSIGLEHTKILGDTIELIAKEKGGIIKSGCPVLVGPNCPHDVLKQCAVEKNAARYYSCEDVLGTIGDNYDRDDYDLENSRISKAALKVVQQSIYGKQLNIVDSMTDEVIELGLSKRPPCRFEIMKMPMNEIADGKNRTLTVILDVAHNPPAMEYLVRKLRSTYQSSTTKFRIVVGMSSDKDLKLCGLSLLNIVDSDTSRIYLVEAAHPRAAKLEAILRATGFQDTNIHYDYNDRSITTGILNAKKDIIQNMLNEKKDDSNHNDEEEEVLIVCGSVFLMSEAREALGIDEPRDTDAITEVAGAGSRHSQENFGNNQSYQDDAIAVEDTPTTN